MKRYEHIDISKGIGILLVVLDYNLLYATILYPEWIVL